jgi:putative FmdB family regulatory protein
MPLHSYHCPKCDKEFELLIRSDDIPVCPTCGAEELQRLMTRSAPALKMGEAAKAARAQAGREGHLSNFSRYDRRR